MTMAETQAAFVAGIEPVLRRLVDRVLPEIARDAIACHVVAELARSIEQDLKAELVVSVAPAALPALQEVLGRMPPAPIRIVPDPELGPAQATVATRAGEVDIDIDATIAALRATKCNPACLRPSPAVRRPASL